MTKDDGVDDDKNDRDEDESGVTADVDEDDIPFEIGDEISSPLLYSVF